MAQRRFRQTQHLGTDSNAAFVQSLDRDFVTLAHFAHHVRFGNAAIVHDQLTGRRRAYAQLVFFLADLEAGEITLHHKAGDALVTGLGIDGGEDQIEARLSRIRDPKLAARQ